MELDIWDGDWGLPSVDLICLQVMAYSKFAGVPLKLQKTNWPWSKYGHLPVFRHGSKVVLTQFDDIVSHLQRQNYSADVELTPRQCSDIIAYTALLRDKLYPALILSMYTINGYPERVKPGKKITLKSLRNYTDLTRPWYAKVLPFPLNYFLPGRQQRAAQKTINALWNSDFLSETQMEVAVYKDAQECLNLLSHRLGDNEFFFGKSTCSLDAIVFGFLAPLLKAPFPNATLQNHLKACPNLSQFVQRILTKYFPVSPEELEAQKQKESDEKEEKQEFPHKWRNIFLTGLFAATAMVGYAFASGMVQVEIGDENSGNEHDEEEELQFLDEKEKKEREDYSY